jgi:hypothetical protein
MAKFKFSDRQATAILEMKLQKLAGLERKKIEDELHAIQELIKELESILKSEKKLVEVVKKELKEVREKYGDDRKTRVQKGGVKEISDEDMIPEKETVIVLTKGGYIKRTDPSEYRVQKRGGVGVVDLDTKDEDYVRIFVSTNTHNDLLFFTDKGKAYQIKTYELPEGKRATKGKSIMNYLSLSGDETVTSILSMPKEMKKAEKLSLFFVTQKGVVKKVARVAFPRGVAERERGGREIVRHRKTCLARGAGCGVCTAREARGLTRCRGAAGGGFGIVRQWFGGVGGIAGVCSICNGSRWPWRTCGYVESEGFFRKRAEVANYHAVRRRHFRPRCLAPQSSARIPGDRRARKPVVAACG